MEAASNYQPGASKAGRPADSGDSRKETGLGQESLYKTLAPGAKPHFDTILKITSTLGLSLEITPKY
jgi:probable addiction module antidote protein